MERNARFGPRAAAIVALLVVAVFGLLFYQGSVSAGPAATTPPSVTRALTIAWSPSQSSYSYASASLQVPVGSVVHFVITSYDPDPVATLPVGTDALVQGTAGGTVSVTQDGATATLDRVSPNALAHTFTISSGVYHLNVPIPAASSASDPVVVTFSATFGVAGAFAWGCVIPCGGQDMTAPGTMYGTLVVA